MKDILNTIEKYQEDLDKSKNMCSQMRGFCIKKLPILPKLIYKINPIPRITGVVLFSFALVWNCFGKGVGGAGREVENGSVQPGTKTHSQELLHMRRSKY